MTRKDYVAIAQAINDVIRPYNEHAVQSLVYEIIDNLCTVFEEDNPRFDRLRFLEACGDRRNNCFNQSHGNEDGICPECNKPVAMS